MIETDKPMNFADSLHRFRRDSERHAASPSTLPIKRCSRCKQAKNVQGGRQRAAIAGPVTRWNPMVFVCKQCVEAEQ